MTAFLYGLAFGITVCIIFIAVFGEVTYDDEEKE